MVGTLRFAHPTKSNLTAAPDIGCGIEGATNMAFKNFKVETDADGIALVTWDIPGRSMNVLDTTTIEELGAIVDQTTADAAVKGVVVTSGKDAFSAGADL